MAIGAPYVASSSLSAPQDVGQKVMQDWLNLGGGPERELTHGRTINDACPQRPCVAHCTLAGQRVVRAMRGSVLTVGGQHACRLVERVSAE